MLGKLTLRASARPAALAAAATAGGAGWSLATIASPPSSALASRARPAFRRSAKKPTALSAATASVTATTSSRNSPARRSRSNWRQASVKTEGGRSAGRAMGNATGVGIAAMAATLTGRGAGPTTRGLNGASKAVEPGANRAVIQCLMSSANPVLPALFISHGSPMLAIEPGSTGAFLRRLGPAIDATFGRPRAIVVVSPHTGAPQPLVLGSATHHAVHDFGGFPRELYALRYAPPGAPELADRAVSLLAAAGIDSARVDDEPGLDHGIWSVLRFAWPDADLPVLPIALAPRAATADQWALGAALAPLAAEGVLVLGSGSLTHNLGLVGRSATQAAGDTPAEQELAQSRAFRDWVAARVAARDREALLAYRTLAPHAALMHPTDEHWLPFYIAAGTGGLAAAPARLHASVTYGSLAMDAYAFGPGAQALHAAVTAPPAA